VLGTIARMITKRARLWLSRGIAAAVMVVFVVLVGSTWLYSGEIESQLLRLAPAGAGPRDLTVVAADAGTVTLPLDERTGLPGTWGLAYEGGYAEVGDVVSTGGGVVTREINHMTGSLGPGTAASLDRMAFDGDPSSRRVPFEEVLVSGPLGDYPAWLGHGSDDTWVLFVHDLGADRREALRLLPAIAALDLPWMAVTYRNDAGAPVGGGRAGLGHDESADLEAAIEFAVSEGASDVVLVGYGVGASIIEVFMHDSRQAGRVAGIVLDGPLLDAAERIDRLAAADRVPRFIVGWAKAVATLRFGIDWGDLDHVAHAVEIAVPTLIIHGENDRLNPVAVSSEFVASAPRLNRLVVVPGAGHGESWNVDPVSYEQAVAGFLGEIAVGPPAESGGEG